MTINENVSLSEYSTMRLGGPAKYLCHIESEKDLIKAVEFAKSNNEKIKVTGRGSNLAWSDEGFDGLVIVNCIDHMQIQNTTLTIGAGCRWDDVVEQSVQAKLSGIEFLSLIPGTAGATPVQNVGAYGAEIKDVLVYLRAYDLTAGKFMTIQNQECEFDYRKSRFNSQDTGRFVITEITLELSNNPPQPPFYKSLQEFFTEQDINDYTSRIIRDAVIEIRESKLPNPEKFANNGSYFSNPIVEKSKFNALTKSFPEIPGWPYKSSIKISAAWLIANSGFKDFHDQHTGMATWRAQPLILINETATSTNDLVTFRDQIIEAVHLKFGITLNPEPEIV